MRILLFSRNRPKNLEKIEKFFEAEIKHPLSLMFIGGKRLASSLPGRRAGQKHFFGGAIMVQFLDDNKTAPTRVKLNRF